MTKARSNAVAEAAKGDLSVGSGTNLAGILAVGNNGETLVADSSTSTGLKWAKSPNAVGASTYKSANQSISSATWTAITFDTELFDTDTFHDNSTNNTRFTIPTGLGGKYLLTAQIAIGSNTVGARGMQYRKNGAAVSSPMFISTLTGFDMYYGNSAVLTATAGDYFELFTWQNSGGALNVIGAASDQTTFQMIYLGA